MPIKALNKMSLKELKAHKADVDAAITNFEARRIAEAKKALEAVAKQHGVSIGEVFGTKKKRKTSKAVVKFVNPNDSNETWSGRGRQPAWFKAALESGTSAESMEI